MKTHSSLKFILCLAILSILLGQSQPTEPRRRDPAMWTKKMDSFAQMDKKTPPPQSPILFVGSSSIGLWKTEKCFPGWGTLNRGFGGSVMYEPAHFFDQVVKPYAPKVVVFYSGDNDIAFGYKPEQVRDDFLIFVKKLHEYNPDTPLIWVSIKPCRARWKGVENLRKANELIKAEVDKDDKLFCMDIDAPLMGADGLPMEHLFLSDRLHLNPDGYVIWSDLLQPLLLQAQRGKNSGDFAGRVELGMKIHCLLFRKKDSPWTAIAWADAPTPLPESLANAKATNIDGSPVSPKELTTTPVCFEFAAIPADWDAQRQCDRFVPGAMVVWPGGPEVSIKIKSDKSIKLSLQSDMPGLTLGTTEAKDGVFTAQIKCDPNVKLGRYENRLIANGDGWSKSWPISLLARPEVGVIMNPYMPGQTDNLRLISNSGRDIEVTLSIPAEAGTCSKSTVTVDAKPQRLTFTPAAGYDKVSELTVKTDRGALITEPLRPGWRDVPAAGTITLDGKLNDWPAGSQITPPMLATNGSSNADLRIAWSPEGLYIAGRLYYPDKKTRDPTVFWDWTAMELFLDTDPVNTDAKAASVAQFWLCPTPGETPDTLRTYAGEAIRSAKLKTKIADDKRIKTALAIDGDYLVMEAFIPVEALGAAPSAGKMWKGALTAQECVVEKTTIQLGWPETQDRDIDGQHKLWGELRFVKTDAANK